MVGSYRVLRRVGAGGMGVVLEAINLDTEGKVALKFLSPELLGNPEAVKRFRLEAKATGRIQHPNVVAVHNIGEHQGQLYLVMEFLRGQSLRDHLTKGLFAVERALNILFPVMRGVAAAHAVGVLHRDLKPENIFLAEADGLEPTPKVLDFGIAKLTSEAEGTSASARTAFMGTYQYMAFEQLHARKDLDVRVDVYALATVLYHVLTGALPYKADNPVDLALAMLQSDPTPITRHDSSLPAGLSDVITVALARDREQRFPDIDTFATALEPWAGGLRYRQTVAGASFASPMQPGVRAAHPTPSGVAGWQSPGPSDSGRVPSVAPSPTPFVVRKDPDEPVTVPKRRSLGLLVGSGVVLGGLGVGAIFFLRWEAVAPPPPPPAAAVKEPTPVRVQDSAASAPVPRSRPGDAGLAVENDDWETAAPSAPPLPAEAKVEPSAEPLHIDPRAGQPDPVRRVRTSEEGQPSQVQRTHRRARREAVREEPSSERPRSERPNTRSGLGVSPTEF